MPPPRTPGRLTPSVVMALTVLVFGVAVWLVARILRQEIAEQMLARQADAYTVVAQLGLDNSAALGLGEQPAELVAAVLEASKVPGVLGIGVFDATGKFLGGAEWGDAPGPGEWAKLSAGQSIPRLHRGETLSGLMHLPPAADEPTFPVLEAWVPLRRTKATQLAGAAKFWIRGEQAVNNLAALDRGLIARVTLVWLVGAVAIVAALSWAFRRLATANRELQERGEDLQQANRELVLAAKTSALGAVTAHLIHEMKNPLAGLETFVASQAEQAAGENGEELAAASQLTRRLRTMVNDVVGVLRDEQGGAHFDLSSGEILELVREKSAPDAAQRHVTLEVHAARENSLPGRTANLARLVLRNLVQNAIEASAPGAVVRVMADVAPGGGAEFVVEDSAGGLPEAIRSRLFQPVASTKTGGSGLGLALSHQLAQQAGGRLELARSDARGTRFRLVLSPEK